MCVSPLTGNHLVVTPLEGMNLRLSVYEAEGSQVSCGLIKMSLK